MTQSGNGGRERAFQSGLWGEKVGGSRTVWKCFQEEISWAAFVVAKMGIVGEAFSRVSWWQWSVNSWEMAMASMRGWSAGFEGVLEVPLVVERLSLSFEGSAPLKISIS